MARLLALAALVLVAPPALAQGLAESPPPDAPSASDDGASILVVVRHEPAADPVAPRPAEVADARMDVDTRYGIGLGGTWRVQGISGTYDLSETLTAEAIVGVLGRLTSLGARAWYRFDRSDDYDLYAYGGASFYRYSVFSETAVGIGGGAGVQADLRKLLGNEDLPPIYLSADAGLTYASFNTYGFSAFTAGSGIHYRF
ncbi:hypothetical protein [Rubrivirga sp.]|uniref:hypothetical protein n=1 Tax=Rubrivirga sp. TaxID=1885344 RepID=UPI003B524D3F